MGERGGVAVELRRKEGEPRAGVSRLQRSRGREPRDHSDSIRSSGQTSAAAAIGKKETLRRKRKEKGSGIRFSITGREKGRKTERGRRVLTYGEERGVGGHAP